MNFGTNTSSNMLISTVMIKFSLLNKNYPFRSDPGQKIKVLCLSYVQFEYAESDRNVHLSCFRHEMPFLLKFDTKHQKCLMIMKFGT